MYFIAVFALSLIREKYEYSMTSHPVFENLLKKFDLERCTITNLNEKSHNSPMSGVSLAFKICVFESSSIKGCFFSIC